MNFDRNSPFGTRLRASYAHCAVDTMDLPRHGDVLSIRPLRACTPSQMLSDPEQASGRRLIGPYLAAPQLHAPERLRDALVHVVHAPLPCVRFWIVDEIVAETDGALIVLENKRKLIVFQIRQADRFWQ
jgi:hypothetical protein